MTTLLEVEQLQTSYGSSQVLFGMHMQIGAGEVATLLGRNGMGKTTTVRSLLGITPASSGSISVLSMSQPAVLSRRPELNDAAATVPNTRKSLRACTLARSGAV